MHNLRVSETLKMEGDSNYISLQEAIKYCGYSQEYLALRTRQGKLKAIKFGRNWVTKKEWIEEYLQKVEEYNNKNNRNNKKNNNFSKKFVFPPKNLPIEKIPALRFSFVTALFFVLLTAGIFFGKESFKNVFDGASPLTQGFSRGFDGGVANAMQNSKFKMQNFEADIFYNVSLIGMAGDIIVEEMTKSISGMIFSANQSFVNVGCSIGSAISNRASQIVEEYSFFFTSAKASVADVGGLFKEYVKWLVQSYFTANNFVEEKLHQTNQAIISFSENLDRGIAIGISNFRSQISNIKNNYLAANDFIEEKFLTFRGRASDGYWGVNEFLEEKISQGFKVIAKIWKFSKETSKEEIVPKPAEDGLVVIPSAERDEEVIKKIKESFSDEVRVEMEDESSGTIIPIFKKGEGEKYFYILVPIQEKN